MADDRGGGATTRTPFLQKIGWTTLTGFVTFAGSALLDKALQVSLADQLVLTFIAGGSALLVQYLADFEQRLKAFERDERRIVRDLQESIRQGFAGVNDATRLHEDIENSALDHEAVHQLIRRVGYFSEPSSPLVLRVANSEMERLAGTLQHLSGGLELFYDGEDREYLLALTEQSQKSIMATAWTTIQGGEGEFWLTDLGLRYLDQQRLALRRGVQIKRVFIFEDPDDMGNELVQRILSTQRTMGVDIRLLGIGPVPTDVTIADLVIFDEEISHETAPVTKRGESGALTTRLVLDRVLVEGRVLRFQELWEAAVEQRPIPDPLQPAGPASQVREDRPSV
ncbi:hypothetical protein ACPPVO_19370 [Dactylosporangium sp. McL0621]|uniref:hypothetical protein n=1 Tax=Dactylosporangium sp. McL0621 TaxID=3415678 RepID=UPI003CF23F65